MKTLIQVKESGDSPSDAARATHATAPDISALSPLPPPESLQTHQEVREMMQRRYTTPFLEILPCQHGGLNE